MKALRVAVVLIFAGLAAGQEDSAKGTVVWQFETGG